MKNKHYNSLELDKILTMVASQTSCKDAVEQILEITPSSDIDTVRVLLQQTSDAHSLIGRFGSPSFSGLKNVSNSVARSRAGGYLTMLELLEVAGVLRVMRTLLEWRKHSEGVTTCLDFQFSALYTNKRLEDSISSAILSEEEMSDNASIELASIRRKMKNTGVRIREQLDKMIKSPTHQKHLQESIVTMRDGRYVVPVKTEFRGEVSGLVHDTSSSGATVFIEPMAVVEANNDLRVLKSKEKAEIERILAELSRAVGESAEEIMESYNYAVIINVIFSKAQLGYTMKGIMPSINDEGLIYLNKARHPLIPDDKVVPITVSLGENYDSLIVTGPNTGGKTVAIKTIGLLTLMAMCGLLIPAYDDSKISIFENVLSDIGDEQSIEQSLSTFSSHMTTIISILKKANDKSLVLMDELGSGTDPVEGAALAIAIIEELRSKGTKVAATTHYAELKTFAIQTAGVENASCEFDVATLKPTYRLLVGIPGRSNAFAISKRLGISDEIVDRAAMLVSAESKEFEKIVQKLDEARAELEKEREATNAIKFEAELIRQRSIEYAEKTEKMREAEIEKARFQASNLVSQAKAQANLLLDEIDKIRKEKNKMDLADAKRKMNSGVRKLEDAANPVMEQKDEDYKLPRELKVGDSVKISTIDKKGEVLALADSKGQVLVQTGALKTKVSIKSLRLIEKGEATKDKKREIPKTRNVKSSISKATAVVTTEIDIRGQSAVEAEMELDQFIDSAVLTGVNVISIIHGKGTGVLRKAVHAHLRHHLSIRTYRLGTYGEGESGVTIAELK